MPIEPRTLTAVFTQVARCLEGHDLALETLDDYRADAAAGLLTVDRLRGFLQGLSAAGALPYEDYCEVDAMLDVGAVGTGTGLDPRTALLTMHVDLIRGLDTDLGVRRAASCAMGYLQALLDIQSINSDSYRAHREEIQKLEQERLEELTSLRLLTAAHVGASTANPPHMAKLKTYCLNLDGTHNVMVAASSQQAAADLIGTTVYMLRTWDAGYNDEDEALALSEPGQVFRQKGATGAWERWTPPK
ncbi:hypothetical protein [Pseudomonas aeruginosa]|uniref:hypothetical protein n=1 Tax=Pseudomonas aeruginosa TaxID=287 RepID=UPI00228F3288|nr:hypothetical protein [Pseudomonas aeruginosa]HCT4812720.1 hypothetical protein [Pseudomonas aeruginosa]